MTALRFTNPVTGPVSVPVRVGAECAEPTPVSGWSTQRLRGQIEYLSRQGRIAEIYALAKAHAGEGE